MLKREGRQGSFWDSGLIEHLIDEDSFEWHFKRVVRPLISDEDFAWAYSPDRGRIAIPPSLVACALILQQRYRLSDREMERQIRFNLATKYALGLPLDDEGFDHTVLCKFRVMLVENDQAKVCFDRHDARDRGHCDPEHDRAFADGDQGRVAVGGADSRGGWESIGEEPGVGSRL